MKNIVITSSLRAATLIATLFVLSSAASAKDAAPDPVAQMLQLTGSVPVNSAGPYVEIGTYKIQVSTKLGQPAYTLADGTWLYKNFSAEDSHAKGTLVVHFSHGQVSDLTLVSPAVVTALLNAPKKTDAPILIAAAQERR